MIRLCRVAPDVRTLGPGVRFCVWVQGCPRRCPGCMSPETQPLDGGEWIDEETLVARMRPFDFEGLTISGGEPILQSPGLLRLILLLRAERDAGVILYTGYTLEELKSKGDPDVLALLGQVDALIDGPYIQALDDDGALRGSSNQRIHFFTDRYRALEAAFGVPGAREQQMQIDDQGVLIIGLRKQSRSGPAHTEGAKDETGEGQQTAGL